MSPSIGEPDELQRSELLRQLAELDRLEPAAEIDRAVAERARRALRLPRVSGIRQSVRWLVPAAAGVALVAIATSTLLLRPRPSVSRPASPATRAAYTPQPRLQSIPPRLETVSATLTVRAPSSPSRLKTEAHSSGARSGALEEITVDTSGK